MFSVKLKADICEPWEGGSGYLLCLSDRYRWSFIQLLCQWGRSEMRVKISPLFTYKVEVWCIWYPFSFTELKKMLDLSYNIKHPSELPVDCLLMFLIAIWWESRLLRNDLVFKWITFLSVVPLKTELNYEILEKGHVRFWVQALKLSSSVNYRFIVNDKAITSAEVQPNICLLQNHSLLIIIFVVVIYKYIYK